jgi:hypothetical protein
MWAGHAVAALVTVVALYRGERMLMGLRDLAATTFEWLHGRLGLVLFTQRPSTRRRLSGIRPAAAPALLAVPVRALRRRGPPALTV